MFTKELPICVAKNPDLLRNVYTPKNTYLLRNVIHPVKFKIYYSGHLAVAYIYIGVSHCTSGFVCSLAHHGRFVQIKKEEDISGKKGNGEGFFTLPPAQGLHLRASQCHRAAAWKTSILLPATFLQPSQNFQTQK